jgi:sec-independent protein translocase protein TatA
MNLRPPEILLMLLFGAKRLPDTARAFGESLKIFKKSVRDEDRDQQTAAQPRQPQRQITTGSDTVEPSRVDERQRVER